MAITVQNWVAVDKIDAAYDAIRRGDLARAEIILAGIVAIVGMGDPVVSKIKLEMARKNRLI